MFKYLSAIAKWVLRKETLNNALFGIQIAKSLYTNPSAPNLKKNQSVIRHLEIAQQGLDTLQKSLPNQATEEWAEGINKSKDKKTWGNFTAAISKDKHGKGNDGIDLGLKTKLLGMDLDLGYDPKNGSSKVSVGPFDFNF